jgi:glycolate oxidase
MNQEIIKELIEIVGEDNLTTDQIDKITHSYDATQKKHLPDVVVYASNTEEISRIVKVANKWNVPLLPRGAGSGLSGGSVPVQGGIVLVLTRMDRILEIDDL